MGTTVPITAPPTQPPLTASPVRIARLFTSGPLASAAAGGAVAAPSPYPGGNNEARSRYRYRPDLLARMASSSAHRRAIRTRADPHSAACLCAYAGAACNDVRRTATAAAPYRPLPATALPYQPRYLAVASRGPPLFICHYTKHETRDAERPRPRDNSRRPYLGCSSTYNG